MSTQQPEALAQECADYATSLRSAANVAKLEGRAPPVSFLRAADLFERAASRIAETEAQLAQRFDAADMATAAAQGFRDGVASAALASTPAQPAPSAAVGQILEKINSLIASINEAHHAKDPLWRQGCFDAADSLYRQIKEMLAAAPGPADGESNELC